MHCMDGSQRRPMCAVIFQTMVGELEMFYGHQDHDEFRGGCMVLKMSC